MTIVLSDTIQRQRFNASRDCKSMGPYVQRRSPDSLSYLPSCAASARQQFFLHADAWQYMQPTTQLLMAPACFSLRAAVCPPEEAEAPA